MRLVFGSAAYVAEPACYNFTERAIYIDTHKIRRMTRGYQWRRNVVALLAHEFTHYLLHRLGRTLNNPYEIYGHELICYRVQFLLGRLFRLRHICGDVESWAIVSTTAFIHRLKLVGGGSVPI